MIAMVTGCYANWPVPRGCDTAKDRNISSGQLMLLQAMQIGQTGDCDTHRCIVRVCRGRPYRDILSTMNRLNYATHCTDYMPIRHFMRRLLKNAKRKVVDEFSERKLGEHVGAILL